MRLTADQADDMLHRLFYAACAIGLVAVLYLLLIEQNPRLALAAYCIMVLIGMIYSLATLFNNEDARALPQTILGGAVLALLMLLASALWPILAALVYRQLFITLASPRRS